MDDQGTQSNVIFSGIYLFGSWIVVMTIEVVLNLSLMIRMVTVQYDNGGADDADDAEDVGDDEAGDAEDHGGEVGNNHATG